MNLTEVEKVAVLLIALGSERAQGILDQLGTGDLIPIISAMKRMRKIDPEVRRAVLEEVAQILKGLSGRRESGNLLEDEDLFGRIEPLLPEALDPDRIDWDSEGFDFGPVDRPPEEDV